MDVIRIMRFAVKRCAADKLWLTPGDEGLALLGGAKTSVKLDTPPVKPEALIRLHPELH